MTYHTDADIIKGINSGDGKALEALYQKHYQAIQHYVFNNSGSTQDAKDIYQDAVILFYEKITEESLQLTCSIATYLYAVSRRLWLKRLSEKRMYGATLGDFEAEIREEDLVSPNDQQYVQLEAALNAIGNPCKEILEDYYVHHLSMGSISEKFGYTNADNAKNQKYKCLVRLKKLFFNQPIDIKSMSYER
jgi:RNA polymerase sigma factor (sigma-70 family)